MKKNKNGFYEMDPLLLNRYETWSQEGSDLVQLRFWSGEMESGLIMPAEYAEDMAKGLLKSAARARAKNQ